MKKIFLRLICYLLIFTVSGCSSKIENLPDKVAENYLNGLAEKDFDTMDQYSIVEYDKIHKAIIEGAMEKYSKTESEIYEAMLIGKDVENKPSNYEDYKKIIVDSSKKDLEEEYGENYSINTTVISSTDIVEEDKAKMLKEASDYYDKLNIVISNIVNFSEIKEVKKMQCKVYISGTEETTEEFSIYVVKTGNEWKVLNIGIGD